MKNLIKLFLLLTVFTFVISSCNKDDDINSPTTYTFAYKINNLPTIKISAGLFEYDQYGRNIAVNKIDSCVTDSSYTYTASDHATMVKIHLIIKDRSTNRTDSLWINDITWSLDNGKNTIFDAGNDLIKYEQPPHGWGMIII